MIDKNVEVEDVRWLACGLVIFAGISMVTNIRFYSFKDFNLRRSVPFMFVVAIALGFAVVSYDTSGCPVWSFCRLRLSGYTSWRLTQRSGRGPHHRQRPERKSGTRRDKGSAGNCRGP
jgi:phosphatidylserine synthase